MRLSHRTKNLLLIISLAFNFGVCLAFGMQAYNRSERPDWRSREHEHERERAQRPDFAEQLRLTPEQRTAFEASKDRMFADMREQWGNLRAESDKLTDLIVAPQLDREAIAAQSAKVAELRAKIHARFITHYLELRDLLAPDQIEAFAKMVRARCSDRGKPFQRPGPGDAHWKSRHTRHGPREEGGDQPPAKP